jgi:serpin B
MGRRWIAAVGVLALLAAACGSDTEPEAGGDGTERTPTTPTSGANGTDGSASTGDTADTGEADPGEDDQAAATPTSVSGPSTESSESTQSERRVVRPIRLAVPERSQPSANPELAGSAITSFGFDLFSAARRSLSGEQAENLTVSPTSVAVALAMLEPGTVEDAQGQVRALMAITDAERFHRSMNSLQADLEARQPSPFGDQDPGEITIRIANAAYLQQGYPFLDEYLATIGANYGPVLYEVDFRPDPDAVGRGINDFVADATEDQITDLIADGVISPDTVLALINALYFKGSWLSPFEEAETVTDRFTRLDGTTVEVDLMQGIGNSSAAGDGWIGATKSYTGDLEAQFILPDDGRFDEIAADLSSVLAEYERNRTSHDDLSVPRFKVRSQVKLDEALKALGMTAPYENGGLLGIAEDPQLVVDKVIHETVVAMDEEGTEAAAATVLLSFPTSGPPSPPVPVVLDRPFLYRIVDRQTGATLFVGQVVDPVSD